MLFRRSCPYTPPYNPRQTVLYLEKYGLQLWRELLQVFQKVAVPASQIVAADFQNGGICQK